MSGAEAGPSGADPAGTDPAGVRPAEADPRRSQASPTAADVQRLLAIEEIRQLAFRYAHAFASRDRPLMLSLWARTDPPARMPTIDRHRIQADLERWFSELGLCLLHVTNHLIDVEGPDHARGEVYCTGEIEVGSQWVDQVILYHDRYVREDGRWLFASREHRLFYGQARVHHPLRQPPARWPRGQVGSGDLPGSEQRGDRAAVDRPGGAGDVA